MLGTIPTTVVLAMLSFDNDDDNHTVQGTLAAKRLSPHYPTLLKQIRQDGITTPILISNFEGTRYLGDGHHRIAAAVDLGLETVPWTDDATLGDRIAAMAWRVTPGVVDGHAVRAFKYGACGGLAIAVHDATGWPIIAVGACDGMDMHYMVRSPAGFLIDIEGAHTDDDIVGEYEFDADDGIVTLAEAARERVWSWYRGEEDEPVPMDVVRTLVGPVLELAGGRRS